MGDEDEDVSDAVSGCSSSSSGSCYPSHGYSTKWTRRQTLAELDVSVIRRGHAESRSPPPSRPLCTDAATQGRRTRRPPLHQQQNQSDRRRTDPAARRTGVISVNL